MRRRWCRHGCCAILHRERLAKQRVFVGFVALRLRVYKGARVKPETLNGLGLRVQAYTAQRAVQQSGHEYIADTGSS